MEKAKRRLIIFVTLFLVTTSLLGLLFMNILVDLQDEEFRQVFTERITSLGIRGVLSFFVFHVFKMVVVVIPGGPLQVIAGAAFGAWGGVLLLLAGCAVGTILIYFLVKKFGQRLIVRFFGIDVINVWGFLKDEKKLSLTTFILFFIPGFPKDSLTYLIPLTKMPLYQFVTISLLARFPAMLSSTIMGDAAIQGRWTLFLVLFAVTAIFGIVGIQFRERILRYFSAASKSNT